MIMGFRKHLIIRVTVKVKNISINQAHTIKLTISNGIKLKTIGKKKEILTFIDL